MQPEGRRKTCSEKTLKFHQETSVKKLNVDDAETVQNKKGKELLEVYLDDPKTLLAKKRVFIGQNVISLIKSLDLSPTSRQLDKFFTNVYSFHTKLLHHR